MPEQVGQPLTVSNIGLSSWHSFDVAGIDKYYFNAGLQDVEDWFPINASAFDCGVSAAFTTQPVEQGKQVISHS
jgi:hypothetical protein